MGNPEKCAVLFLPPPQIEQHLYKQSCCTLIALSALNPNKLGPRVLPKVLGSETPHHPGEACLSLASVKRMNKLPMEQGAAYEPRSTGSHYLFFFFFQMPIHIFAENI